MIGSGAAGETEADIRADEHDLVRKSGQRDRLGGVEHAMVAVEIKMSWRTVVIQPAPRPGVVRPAGTCQTADELGDGGLGARVVKDLAPRSVPANAHLDHTPQQLIFQQRFLRQPPTDLLEWRQNLDAQLPPL
jgi:hypothetical protein